MNRPVVNQTLWFQDFAPVGVISFEGLASKAADGCPILANRRSACSPNIRNSRLGRRPWCYCLAEVGQGARVRQDVWYHLRLPLQPRPPQRPETRRRSSRDGSKMEETVLRDTSNLCKEGGDGRLCDCRRVSPVLVSGMCFAASWESMESANPNWTCTYRTSTTLLMCGSSSEYRSLLLKQGVSHAVLTLPPVSSSLVPHCPRAADP